LKPRPILSEKKPPCKVLCGLFLFLLLLPLCLREICALEKGCFVSGFVAVVISHAPTFEHKTLSVHNYFCLTP